MTNLWSRYNGNKTRANCVIPAVLKTNVRERLKGITTMRKQDGIAPPDPDKISDPTHWRERAEQAFAMADAMGDAEAREAMLKVAEQYERLAQWALDRAASRG